MQRFRAKIETVRHGHYVIVPERVAMVTKLEAHMRVRGTVAGKPHRSSLMKKAGVFMMGIHKETLTVSGVKAGDLVDIELEPDMEARPNDEPPASLVKALKGNAVARKAWEALAPSHRREHVKHLNDAKKEITRQARVEKLVKLLSTPKT